MSSLKLYSYCLLFVYAITHKSSFLVGLVRRGYTSFCTVISSLIVATTRDFGNPIHRPETKLGMGVFLSSLSSYPLLLREV